MSVNFASYSVGSVFTVNGKEWTVTSVTTRKSKSGRDVRVFTITDGEKTIQKTSRGLTFWINGNGTAESDDEQSEEKAVNAGVAAAIAAAIGPYMEAAGAVDADEVKRIVDERIAESVPPAELIQKMVDERVAAMIPQRVEFINAEGVSQDMGVQHTHFEALLRAVSAGLNIWLVGPAGSGKTSAAFAVAKALGLKPYAKSIGPQTTESALLGYYDANGNYVRTQLRDAYEHGGVFLLDEVDSAPAGIVVANAVLANTHAAFPDRVVERHPDFRPIAGANTIGQGADRQYVGRQQIDAATLDRFVFLPWDSDPVLESNACGVPMEAFAGLPRLVARKFHDADGAANRCGEFVKRTTRIRMSLAKLGSGVRMIVGNRTNIHGTALVRAGWTVDDALEATVWRGCDRDLRAKVEANC